MDGSGELLAEFAKELSGRLHFEIIGYPPDLALGYEDLSAYVLPKLPKKRPFVLLGESFGGPLALTVAAGKPHGLVGVILCASFAKFPVGAVRALGPLVKLGPAQLPLPLLSWVLLGPWATSSWRARIAQGIGRLSPSVRRARVVAALGVDLLPAVGELTMPLLCIRATEDRLVWGGAGRALVASARIAQLIDVRAPHFVLQSAPKECAEAVVSWVQELRSN
jgi:pimeloyl-ACP methyl ester carboxylesterase